ncbi:GroES-like protein [Lentinus tigrinus ALCF2SS1-7]|uniref:GroES-like protein n=1 Tax=Lentinus tigrinus ALCF2SS1-6 TaxID=1328759 RepID=A0A5C2SU65_9APHY|nr:GroES-like protein [Lentinus tigrinus ALCF2SS1-6]RPD80549.1 GroES-like protein [Lentinus tigrinus ALCF2SS1-7]
MTAIPATMKAVVLDENLNMSYKDHPVPPVGAKDVLIKTVSVAQNPTDFKHVDWKIGVPGTIVGCDFSGTVVQVGPDVSSLHVGDHVAGFVHGATFSDDGAFAEYVRAPADLVWRVPKNTLSHDQAATVGLALWTAVQALYHPARLGLVEPPAKAPSNEWILVFGGSSAVGQFSIQLLRLSGYKIVTTASPRNFELVKSLGADAVFDYRDPEVVAKIKAVTGDSLTRVFDAISEVDSQRISAASLGPAGEKIIVLLSPQPGATDRTDVEFCETLVYTALGRAFAWPSLNQTYPVSESDRAHMVQFVRNLPGLVKEGAIRPLAVKLWEGGLAAVSDGMQYMREGKVSAQKIVYRV